MEIDNSILNSILIHFQVSKGINSIIDNKDRASSQSKIFDHNRGLKVRKFQNEFIKSSFLPKYEPNIVRISVLYCAILQVRNPYKFWFIFWEK